MDQILNILICIVQREISNAADIAARLYREATPEDRRSATEIWETMTKAQDRLIKTIRGRNFEKYISVAHKDNGDDFFLEVPTLHVFFFHFILVFVVVFVLFLTCISLHCRLTVIILPFLCLTCLSRNFKRWPPHMWMHLSRLGGFGGGTPPPMSRPLTSFLLLFLYARRSLMIGFIGLRFGHRYSNPTLLCVVLLLSFFVFSNLHVCVLLVGEGC